MWLLPEPVPGQSCSFGNASAKAAEELQRLQHYEHIQRQHTVTRQNTEIWRHAVDAMYQWYKELDQVSFLAKFLQEHSFIILVILYFFIVIFSLTSELTVVFSVLFSCHSYLCCSLSAVNAITFRFVSRCVCCIASFKDCSGLYNFFCRLSQKFN